MPVIVLIRHGENDYVKKGRLAGRLPGIHLNEMGRQQAQTVAEKLANVPVKAIYSSPLERAMETAEPLARILKLDIVQLPGLIEVDVGEWQGQRIKGLSRQKLWKMVQSSPSRVQFPGGEFFASAQYRICQDLLTLARQYERDDIVVCVTHSDPIKLAVTYFIGLPLDSFQRLHVAPASLTALFLGDGVAQLLTLNYDFFLKLGKV